MGSGGRRSPAPAWTSCEIQRQPGSANASAPVDYRHGRAPVITLLVGLGQGTSSTAAASQAGSVVVELQREALQAGGWAECLRSAGSQSRQPRCPRLVQPGRLGQGSGIPGGGPQGRGRRAGAGCVPAVWDRRTIIVVHPSARGWGLARPSLPPGGRPPGSSPLPPAEGRCRVEQLWGQLEPQKPPARPSPAQHPHAARLAWCSFDPQPTFSRRSRPPA